MRVSLAFIIFCFFITFNVSSSDPTHFTDDVSINCGSTATSSAYSGRQWLGDVQPRASPLLQLKGISTTSTASRKSISADQVPYRTARVSRSWFSYAFRVNSGQIIIRLHFNPSAYRGFKGLKDLFTVEAGSFTLLSNFSASLTAHVLGVNSLTKEYCLNIQENQRLDITLSAETSQSKDAYAFINGIEIISVPAGLSYFKGTRIGLQVVGRNSLVHVDDSIALEMIYRQNIKQADDSGDIFGIWPRKEVGNINNFTWKVSVDVGFRYLVRLHFSKLGLKMAETGGLNFKVYINEMIADTNTDIVVKERDGSSIPWYGDCIVMMNGRKQEGKRDLLIRLQSNDEFMDGILKGFEILKLSNPDNCLASPIPMPTSHDSTSQTNQFFFKVLGNRNAIGSVSITVLCIVCFIVHKLREILEASPSEEANKPSARAERLCRRFSLSEMQLATRNFSDGLLIGKGGFGKVYKGLIDKEQTTVAVKRLKSNSNQGAREFLTEIETLSELRHINLVSLIGYCSEGREMILVYEYMARGTLADHLYNFARRGVDASSLTWKQCLNICIGAARGLDYLHTGHRVIHRDVKASNILLDDNFVAKVSDFGLAKAEDRSKSQSHVSTRIKGTCGYLDPYYHSTGKLTRKSDTYAFGVVLLEVLCGRAAVDFEVSEEERMLTMWARDKLSKGEVNQIVAASLRDEISANSQKTFVGIIVRCLHDEPKNRPTMSQVVFQLELALGQQDSSQDLVLNEVASVSDEIRPSTSNDGNHLSSTLQPIVESTNIQNLTLPPTEQTNNKVILSGKKHKGAFWNRINPIKSIIANRAAGIKLPSHLCRHFSLDDIKTATRRFSDSLIIGDVGFGKVYVGVIDGATTVAIKRLGSSSYSGADEFVSEIMVMSKLRHLHLVSLIGYCNEKGEMILVYEYMPRGSLRDYLYNSILSPLTWKQRLQICLGVAKGLHYLHTGVEQTIIHRDVKSPNILLNDKWEAKVCEFGQSKVCQPRGDVTTSIQGTLGYLDPEYFQSSKLTDKSDVYSFGVTMFEVLCARPPIDSTLPLEQRSLAAWATFCHGEGTLGNIIDSIVKGQIAPECLKEFVGTAIACLRLKGVERPSMRDVVLSLESAIKFQESELLLSDEESMAEDVNVPKFDWNQIAAATNHFPSSSIVGHGRSVAEEESMAGDADLPMFDWDQIAAATNHFSLNIIGRGRFGGVYKGVLPSGEVVAVKRRSPSSAEGLEELKNEMNLLPNLRHPNIIKLLGCCMHGEELLLVYEFMKNTSLDYFIDKGQIQHLHWAVRFQMIMGIARGLVFLHQNSRMRVIHGDLSISNILLDLNMNPRISDFDVASSMAKFQTEIVLEESEIKATHGCMPPEYYMYGSVSVKSDVYSFGIILLEIISGKRMFSLYLSRSLVTHRGRQAVIGHGEDRALIMYDRSDLVHDSLGSEFQGAEVIRCINVARLCLQGHPDQRPLMSSVIKMLEGNEEIIQQPLWPPREVPAGISENSYVGNEEIMQLTPCPPIEVPAGISENAYVDNGGDFSNATFELVDTRGR